MKYSACVFLLLLHTLIAENTAPSISVPSSIRPCSLVPLEINGGIPPYSVSLSKADNSSGLALQEFTDVRQPSNLSWSSDLLAGAIIFEVKDSKGATASGQSSVSGSCAQNHTAFNAAVLPNKFDDVIPPQTTNSTASPLNPISPTDGSIANSSSSTNVTQRLPTTSIAANGTGNSTDVNMGSLSPVNSVINPPASVPVTNVTVTQPRPSNNTGINNQTNKPSPSTRSSSACISSPLKSIQTIFFISLVVVLATLI